MNNQLTQKTFMISANILIEPDENSFYATCPAFEGLHTCGDSEEEAIENVKNAIVAYVLSLIKHNEPIPCCKIIEEKKFKAMTRPKVKSFKENIPIPAWVWNILKNIWNQLKNKSADDFISALQKDGWNKDTTIGAEQIFRHPDGRRISIHYHPRKTYQPKLLKRLLEDIGWTENEMKKLKFIKK